MTPAARFARNHAAANMRSSQAQGPAAMNEEQARALCDQLETAMRDDDEEKGKAATMALITGVVVNIARIAEALEKRNV